MSLPTTGAGHSIWGVQFYKENDGIAFGSGGSIDDLPSADCTIEFWALLPENIAVSSVLLSKANAGGTIGWQVFMVANRPRIIIRFDDTDINMDLAPNNVVFDGKWHHFAVDWDFGTLTARSFTDGGLVATGTAVGTYDVDAAVDCIANGRATLGQSDTNFSIGWIRLSNSRRYTGASFERLAQNAYPANDANAQLLVYMNDGVGVTATDSSGNGYDGTITFGASTRWYNDPV